MILLTLGCSFHGSPLPCASALAFSDDHLPAALETLTSRLRCEAVILSTCNRVEILSGPLPRRRHRARSGVG